MRLLLVSVFAVALCAESIAVLDQAQIRNLERTLVSNPADREAQALLGQNYALVILGITKLGKYDRVEAIDPARAADQFSQHARDALRQSQLAAVVGEGGYALWQYSGDVAAFQILHPMPDQRPLLEERALAIEAIDRAVSLEPDNPQWRRYRIPLLSLRSGTSSDLPTLTVADAYDGMRKDIAEVKGTDRYSTLAYVAKMAVRASAWKEATSYARELLDRAADDQHSWNFGNAVFYGNMVLGQVALHEGDKSAAARYLLASGKTKGSPQLNSFGPNMSLAKEMLVAGDRDTVLAFLDLCATFWKMDRGRLAQWKKAVEEGRPPDFGANLYY